MARKFIDKEQMAYMCRNDKKSQQTHLVATLVAKMPNNVEYTETSVEYGTVLIPEQSIVGSAYVVITEAFDAGATFDVGVAGDLQCFFASVDGATVSTLASTMVSRKYLPVDTEVIITPTYAGDNETGRISVVLELFELEASIGRYTR